MLQRFFRPTLILFQVLEDSYGTTLQMRLNFFDVFAKIQLPDAPRFLTVSSDFRAAWLPQ